MCNFRTLWKYFLDNFLKFKASEYCADQCHLMDRTWVRHGSHFSKEYVKDLIGFMNFVRDRFRDNDKILCACTECLNLKYSTQIHV
jgi:hypothetical protein